MSSWNGNRFSVYTSEEKSVLGLIKEMGDQTNYNSDEIERLTQSDNKKVSHQEMQELYKIDKQANFTGSWFGIKRPTQSDVGLAGTVEQLIDETIPGINSQLEQNEKIRQTISFTLHEFIGSNDIDRLQKAHDYIELVGGGTLILPKEELTLTDTFRWNISRVNIKGIGTKIKFNINDINKYGVKIVSESLLEYAPSQNNKMFCGSGFELDGVNRNCKGILFENINSGTSSNTISNLIFERILIRRFDVGLDFGSNAYMIDFNNCVISFNRINIQQKTPKTNAGERITFTGSDITGTQGIENSICINNLDFTTFQFINCSLDWHRRLFFNKGLLIFDNCHIESPEYALTDPLISGQYYGECGLMGHVYFNGGRVLLNHNPVNLEIKALFNLTDSNSSVNFSNMILQTYNIDFLSTGKGYTNLENVRFPKNGLEKINFYISDNDRNNCFLDNDYSFSNNSTQDKYIISNSSNPQVIGDLGGKKCIKIRNTNTESSFNVIMQVPVKSIMNYMKFGFEYYMEGKPSLIEIKGYTSNGCYVYKILSETTGFTTSNNNWVSYNKSVQLCSTLVNLDLISYVEIKIVVEGMSEKDGFYIANPRFTSF